MSYLYKILFKFCEGELHYDSINNLKFNVSYVGS